MIKDQKFHRLFIYCGLCDCYVSILSKHCRICNRCVYLYDHHCIWINSCVGANNYKQFFMMIISALSLMIVYMVSIALVTIPLYNDQQLVLLGISWAVGISVGVLLVLLLNLVGLHCYLIAKGITTYQFLTENKYLRQVVVQQLPSMMQLTHHQENYQDQSRANTPDNPKPFSKQPHTSTSLPPPIPSSQQSLYLAPFHKQGTKLFDQTVSIATAQGKLPSTNKLQIIQDTIIIPKLIPHSQDNQQVIYSGKKIRNTSINVEVAIKNIEGPNNLIRVEQIAQNLSQNQNNSKQIQYQQQPKQNQKPSQVIFDT